MITDSKIRSDEYDELDFEKGFGRFPHRPTPEQISKLNDYYRSGHTFESHPDICLAEPDLSDQLMIVGKVDATEAARATNERIWCAFCKCFKFFDGNFIWSEEKRTLYPIGEECARRKLGHFTWTEMNDDYKHRRQSAFVHNTIIDTFENQTLSNLARTLERLVPLANHLDKYHSTLFKDQPDLASLLHDAGRKNRGELVITRKGSRTGYGPSGFTDREGGASYVNDLIGVMLGANFVQKNFRASSAIQRSLTELRILNIELEPDGFIDRVASFSEDRKLELAERIIQALRKANDTEKKLIEAGRFLTIENFTLLQKWTCDPDFPLKCSALVEGRELVISGSTYYRTRLAAINIHSASGRQGKYHLP